MELVYMYIRVLGLVSLATDN